MNIKLSAKSLTLFESAIAGLAFILLSLPAFNMTGLIVRPLLLCIIGGALISLVLLLRPKGETVCGYGLLIFVLFWATFVLVKQLELQFAQNFPGKWIYFFYFDKLLMIGTIWLSSISVFIVERISNRRPDCNYKAFFKSSSLSFIIFYAFLLIYSFVLIRLEKGTYPLNWVPFNTIKEYISDYSSIPYEVFMMFFGNLLYFTPLGVIFHLVLRKKNAVFKILVTVLFPVAAFSLLEYSQYYFQNGFCEFDDMMMNSLGFWLGAVIGTAADKVVYKLSRGRTDCFWG